MCHSRLLTKVRENSSSLLRQLADTLPMTTSLFHSEVNLHKMTKLIMRGDSSFHSVILGMTDHICYIGRGDICGGAANIPSHSHKIIVIPNEADEGGVMRNLSGKI